MYTDTQVIEQFVDDINENADFNNTPRIKVWLSDTGYRIDAIDCDGNTIDPLAAGMSYAHMFAALSTLHNYMIL